MQKSNFRERVRDVVKGIPRGATMTYKEVASRAGNPMASRGVASIMKANFDPEVPCHRVVRSDGTVGGYNRGGEKAKRSLLEKNTLCLYEPRTNYLITSHMHRYSYRIEQAIRAASILHKEQVRKGDIPYPYVTHTFAVALIVADYTDKEDVIIGALLHDTLEDTDYTRDELLEDFGGTVLTLVESLTRPEEEGLSWIEAKRRYVKQLKNAPEDALIIACGDKIHNMRSMVEMYYGKYEELLADFGGSLEERLMMYQEISNIFNRRLTNAILGEFNHVFEEFKQFIAECEKAEEAKR